MAGENGLLTADGYGTYSVVVQRISYGLNIIATEEETATFKYLYTRQVQTDVFSIEIVFVTSEARTAFSRWYQGYARQAIQPSPVGVMRVQVPNRNFDMFGTPTDGVEESTTVTDVTWPMTITFHGGFFAGQNSYVNDSNIVSLSTAKDAVNPLFYPTGTNINGPVYDPAGTAPVTSSAAVQWAIVNSLNQGWQ